MCGRYYLDEETAIEIEKVVRDLDKKIRRSEIFRARDINPGDAAPVLVVSGKEIELVSKRWGYPGFERNKLIFNARSESAMEKRLFRDGVERWRMVVPAAWFYEWNKNKEKNIFYRKDSPILFMAGIYNRYPDEDRFTILTTRANASMEPVHDRMPLLLEPDEVKAWLLDGGNAENLLHKTPGLLDRRTEYGQMNLFQM